MTDEVDVSDKIVVNTQYNDPLKGPMELKDGPFCIICELLIARLKSTVDTKAKRNHIVHSIIETCDHLPNFIREPCHVIVSGYGEVVLDLISKVTPHEMCHILKTNYNHTTSDGLGFSQNFDKELDEFLNTNFHFLS